MKLQFKEQQFQLDAVKAVVDCFAGQPIKTNRFTLERSKDIINKANQLSKGQYKTGLEEEVMENYKEDITKYPTPDKQYDGAKKYETYESVQTGAMGKSAK